MDSPTMSEQPVTSTAEGSFNVDLRGVHYDFLKDRVPTWFTQASSSRQEELASHEMELPSWYLTATAQEKTALAQSHTRYRETLNQVENTLGDIKDVLAFAEQPLKDAIKKQFNLDLDVKNVYFARKYGFKGRDDLLGAFVFEQRSDPSLRYEYRGVSLLEAALANFAPDEARAGACNDCQIITTWNAYDGEIIPTFSAVNSQALPIAPPRVCTTVPQPGPGEIVSRAHQGHRPAPSCHRTHGVASATARAPAPTVGAKCRSGG